jgi:hypothetical protein
MGALDMLNDILEELPLPNDDIPPPANLDVYFRELVNAVQAVKVEDRTAHMLVRQLQQENLDRRPPRTPSPAVFISDDDRADDIYEDDEPTYVDDEGRPAARSDSGSKSEEDQEMADFIDDEAEEVPEGEESSPAVSSSGASGESIISVSSRSPSRSPAIVRSSSGSPSSPPEEEDTVRGPSPPSVLALVDYGSEDDLLDF